MAGHSQFKNIMHRKGAQDAKRARQFAKLIREITVSARTGLPDPATNPRLRTALIDARVANMPKDTIDRAIKKGTGARALRSLLERLMLDIMYDVPSNDDILHIHITQPVVMGDSKPLIRRKPGRAAA